MRGGYRPGAGRKTGAKDKAPRKGSKPKAATPEPTDADKIRQMLSMSTKAKARFYQEFLQRVGRGEKLTLPEKKMMDKIGVELEAEVKEKPEETGEAPVKLEPLDFILQVMNDPSVDKELRCRMAVAAAPFIHPRKGEGAGKKEDREDRAKRAGAGKFAASAPPVLKAVNRP